VIRRLTDGKSAGAASTPFPGPKAPSRSSGALRLLVPPSSEDCTSLIILCFDPCRYDLETHTWSASEPGLLRLDQSLESGMTRLRAASTAPGRSGLPLINCFLAPRMHLEVAQTFASGNRYERAYTLSTANGEA
jgi:hypothetical protein